MVFKLLIVSNLFMREWLALCVNGRFYARMGIFMRVYSTHTLPLLCPRPSLLPPLYLPTTFPPIHIPPLHPHTMLQRFNDFLDLFRNNLLFEYNNNLLLKSKLIPISKYYSLICTGDRIFLKYLNKLKYFTNSKTFIPQYYGGLVKKIDNNNDNPIINNQLPLIYNFNLKNYLNFIFLKFKNLFLDNKTLLKFKIEEEVIPKLNLKDIRNIEYLGKNEFVMEGEGKNGSNLQIKIKVKEEEGDVVIERVDIIEM